MIIIAQERCYLKNIITNISFWMIQDLLLYVRHDKPLQNLMQLLYNITVRWEKTIFFIKVCFFIIKNQLQLVSTFIVQLFNVFILVILFLFVFFPFLNTTLLKWCIFQYIRYCFFGDGFCGFRVTCYYAF